MSSDNALKYRTQFCHRRLAGRVCTYPGCTYAHSIEELNLLYCGWDNCLFYAPNETPETTTKDKICPFIHKGETADMFFKRTGKKHLSDVVLPPIQQKAPPVPKKAIPNAVPKVVPSAILKKDDFPPLPAPVVRPLPRREMDMKHQFTMEEASRILPLGDPRADPSYMERVKVSSPNQSSNSSDELTESLMRVRIAENSVAGPLDQTEEEEEDEDDGNVEVILDAQQAVVPSNYNVSPISFSQMPCYAASPIVARTIMSPANIQQSQHTPCVTATLTPSQFAYFVEAFMKMGVSFTHN